MSKITESNYDLYATYSTAASQPSLVQTLSDDTSFADLMLAEENTATDSTTGDSALDDLLDDMEDILDDLEDSTSDSTSGTTTSSGVYYRDDDPLNVVDTPSDSLDFMDMLQLMIMQFQSQTIDNTASTTDMMNQLTQMTTMQAMTSMEASVSEMTATNAMLYNAQLVGQEVTVGFYDDDGNFQEETGVVVASGYYDGVPVIFFEGQTSFHYVASIMAIGKLPEGAFEEDDDTTVDPDDTTVDTDTSVTPDADDTNTDSDSSDTTVDTDTSVDTGATDTGSTDTNTDPDSSGEAASASVQSAYNYVDYSSMTAEELLAAAALALG